MKASRTKISLTLLAFFMLIGLFFACEKQQSQISNGSFTGKWKLTERLADPGDGSGKWTKVDAGSTTYLTFNADSSITAVGQSQISFKKYNVTDSIKVRVTLTDNSVLTYFYKFEGSSSLILSGGGCIEACGSKYVKIADAPF